MKISAVKTYSANGYVINNKKYNKESPAFKGRTADPVNVNEYNFISFTLLGQNMHDYFMGIENRLEKGRDSEEKIADGLAKNIKEYNKRFGLNRFFEKTPNANSTKLYIADPNEIITEDIRQKHGYIVHDREPAFPSFEELQNKYTSPIKNTHDYFKDLKDYIGYQNRVIDSDSKKLEENKEKDTKKYQERIKEASRKKKQAGELLEILSKSGDDFVQRDICAENLASLKRKYKQADFKLKDIEFHKYLTDEGIQGNQTFLERNQKNLSYYEMMGRMGAINSAKRRSEALQKEYDEYLDIKQNGPQKIAKAEAELNDILEKLASAFSSVDTYYAIEKLDGKSLI